MLGHKNGFEMLECSGCGSISARIRPNQVVPVDIYEAYYREASFEIPEPAVASLDRVVASFEPFRCTGRLIDIGYGEGGLLNAAERHGWSCYGTEVDLRVLEFGRRRGWVVGSPEHNELFPEEGFDVVTMIEVLEHVSEPEEFLKTALRLLRPGGVLYLTTPNALSLNRRLLQLEWSVICPPDHLMIWTARGLRVALAGAGFRCEKIRSEGLNPYEIVSRFRRNKRSRPPINRQQRAATLNDIFSRSAHRRATKKAINIFLSACGAGDGLKVWATRVY
jgi:2-polyprenyl-3-methyl-5-hydroxy-6-metoxy-1,4-benzoquinol methylase